MAVEYNLGLVAGSLSSLRPIFVQFGLFGTTVDKSNQFTPSYQLDDRSNSKWGKHSGGRSKNMMDDSALEATLVGDSSEHSDEMRIMKTEDFSVTEEYHHTSSLHQESTTWSGVRESKYV